VDARWRIEFFGGLRAAHGEALVVTRFRTQTTGSLLAYLAYYRQRAHLREELVDLLWPECEPQAGRNNLSQALSSLRRQLEPSSVPAGAVLVADRATVRLNPEAVTTDVAAFQTGLQSAARAKSSPERVPLLAHAVALYRGELLCGYYEPWILGERESLAERYFQALRQLLGLLEQAATCMGPSTMRAGQ
jgi:DNA-binding SARP family transcriptional activator